MRLLILTLTTVVLLGCSQNSGPMPTRLLAGINDTAIYHIGKEGRIYGVEKREYSIPGEMVYLSRDTVELGDDFYAHFGVYKDQFEILVSKPTMDTLTRADFDKLDKDEGLGYTFKTTEKGIFAFEGQISYDTVVRSFKWKFIVIESD